MGKSFEINEMIELVEDYFISMMAEIDEGGDYQVAVVLDDRWENPLPEIRAATLVPSGPPVVIISVTQWTRENSYFDEETGTLHIKTAFGEEENSASFLHTEILGVLDMNGNLVYAKTYFIEKSPMKDKPEDITEDLRKKSVYRDGIKQSMSALMKNNPQLSKKGGKDGN